LPGGGELELTAGPVPPGAWGDEDLLVLYADDRAELERQLDTLRAHGVPVVPAANPYWSRTGRVVLDPDGYRVVLALRDRGAGRALEIGWHEGSREELVPLFRLAESSAEQLAGYLGLGRVLVARRGPTIVGHAQLVPTDDPETIELKNLAVLPEHQRTGVGRQLVEEAVAREARDGRTRMVVSTATIDTDNLRFYQRVGFRMISVEPDAFTPETGYPEPVIIDGMELRDRVWFARTLGAER
jgi:ribosomal protein S18 acetylase RimI-like enzyme